MLIELKDIYEDRIKKLTLLLQDRGLSPERQHQVYGSIKEAERIKKVIEHGIANKGLQGLKLKDWVKE